MDTTPSKRYIRLIADDEHGTEVYRGEYAPTRDSLGIDAWPQVVTRGGVVFVQKTNGLMMEHVDHRPTYTRTYVEASHDTIGG